jgi:hypothetical protein
MLAKAALTWSGGTPFRGWDGCRFSALLLWWCNLVAQGLALLRSRMTASSHCSMVYQCAGIGLTSANTAPFPYAVRNWAWRRYAIGCFGPTRADTLVARCLA